MNITLKSEKEYYDYVENHKATPDANEQYCMLAYVKHLYSIHKKTPIYIEKRESPDFLLQIDNIEIGLEHTQASCQALTYGAKKLDDYPEGSMLEIPDCQHIPASKEAIGEVIRNPGERLQSVGWGDWGAEKFLIAEIIKAIEQKTEKLNRCYKIFLSNELIIYDSLSIPGMRWNYVMPELKKQYKKRSGRSFDKIHLVAGSGFSYDVMSECVFP